MKRIGQLLELGFDVRAAISGEKWQGVFSRLIDRPTLISVYMKNNTGNCDKQMISLAGGFQRIRDLGYDVIGVSKDTQGSHLRYAQKHSILFPLVSDPDYGFARAVDSLVEKKMYGRTFMGPTRSAYVIDEKGKLLAIIEKIEAETHFEQALCVLKNIR